jgi:hypothetical protein
MNSYVKSRIWSRIFHEVQLHIEKIYIRCAVLCYWVVHPLFFRETVTALPCWEVIMHSLYFWMKSDTTEHVTNSNKAMQADFFDNYVTSKNLWTPPLLDLTCPDCYIWVYLKQFIQEHQQNIEKFIATIYWQCFVICVSTF